MFGEYRFRYAITDDDDTTYQKTDNHSLVFFESLKAEERYLRVQQVAADDRKAHPIQS